MNRFSLLAIAAAFALAPACFAQEVHDHGDVPPEGAKCVEGIEFIEAELAKTPADDLKASLERKLRIAERELGEKEWDECAEAVEAARTVVTSG